MPGAPVCSVARGIFVLACLLAAQKAVGAGLYVVWPHLGSVPKLSPVCGAPVAVDTPYGLRLGCADEPALASCDAQACDQLRFVSGHCQRTAHGMPIGWYAPLGRRFNINRAEAAQLLTLPNIGARTAAAIVRHRGRHGPYASIEAVGAVQGVGPGRIAKLRRFVTVDD